MTQSPAVQTGRGSDANPVTPDRSALTTAERRAMALAPTVYCPPVSLDECVGRVVRARRIDP